VDPQKLAKNPENPRLIFRQSELEALQSSIASQGILVPLTVYEEGQRFVLLDGERRWRCALKLALSNVPVIIQPKPDRLTNIMMMFAIHNARRDWDPLPTALKMQELEKEFEKRHKRRPSESELAGLASLRRGEVRRLKKLLQLPIEYREELLAELEKPRHLQEITVDHVLETTKGVEALRKRHIVTSLEENDLRKAILSKFRTNVIKNTVAPRLLTRIAAAVRRGEIGAASARKAVSKLRTDPKYSIDDAFRHSVEQVDFEHSIASLVERLQKKLTEHRKRRYAVSASLRETLHVLRKLIDEQLK
jgi:ParB/RepB/Spo0J family partition protein